MGKQHNLSTMAGHAVLSGRGVDSRPAVPSATCRKARFLLVPSSPLRQRLVC
jgi:hypothetical protein